jgi:hypothetical protein
MAVQVLMEKWSVRSLIDTFTLKWHCLEGLNWVTSLSRRKSVKNTTYWYNDWLTLLHRRVACPVGLVEEFARSVTPQKPLNTSQLSYVELSCWVTSFATFGPVQIHRIATAKLIPSTYIRINKGWRKCSGREHWWWITRGWRPFRQ